MVAFSFKARFAHDVEVGLKRQTIRAERKDKRQPAKPNDALQLYTGMRTKACRKLCDATCARVRRIEIRPRGKVAFITLDGELLTNIQSWHLAVADGFSAPAELIAFFRDTHGLPFSGWLIEW